MQRIKSQVIERTCDACGKTKEYELISLTEETVLELEGWRTLVREVFVEGQFQKVMIQACSSPCTTTADLNFEVKKQTARQAEAQQPADAIDLDSLRQN